MQNPHRDQPLTFSGAAIAGAPLVVVAVHGRTLDPTYMIDNVVTRLNRPDLAYVLPAADGNSWYPASFLAPLEQNQPRLDFALARLDDVLQVIGDAGVDDSRVVWLGFSQGACLVTEYVARSNRRFAALICLTGGLIGPDADNLTRPAQAKGLPTFITLSDHDEWIPLGRAEKTASIFLDAGADVEFVVTKDTAHEVVDDAIARTRSLLNELSPAPAA